MILAVAIFIGLIFILGFVYFKGKQSAEIKQVKNDLKAVQDAKKVEDDINSLNADDVNKQLRDKWTR